MLFLMKVLPFLVASLLVSFFSCYVNIAYFMDFYEQWFLTNVQDVRKYDYIIVGAGSAGSVLAARLAKKRLHVLLVEAGGTAPPFFDIPLVTPLLQGTPYDWQFNTVPQHNACQAMNNRSSIWPAGKILGGTSRLNYMAYVRGHPLDYEKWFPGFVGPTFEGSKLMKVSNLKWNTELADAVLCAVNEASKEVTNINVNSNVGFMKVQLNMDNGRRWSTDKILPLDSKSTLTILTHAHVHKVLFEANKAIGIEFTKSGRMNKAYAMGGVIASAGAIGSPKLLMLSGIGPRDDLQKLNVNVISDLPVGQGLMDHILTGIDLIKFNTSLSLSFIHALNPLSAFNYFLYGQGPWTSSGIEVVGTLHSSELKNESAAPDLQLMVLPAGLAQDNGIFLKRSMGISDEVYNKYYAPLARDNTATIAPVLLHPKSVGYVKLRSIDPLDPPVIDPKYLSNPEDVEKLIDGIEFVKALLQTDGLKAIGASLNKRIFPGCEEHVFDTRIYWECYIRHLTLTSYHPAGTCRMGNVVDSSFRVYNVSNLYVVDASVLPQLPSGNIHAAVVMLAEKAARSLTENLQRGKQQLNKCQKDLLFCDLFRSCNRSTVSLLMKPPI